MAEMEEQHFFNYTDPNRALLVRLDRLEERLNAVEQSLKIGTPPAHKDDIGQPIEPDGGFREWARNEIQGLKMRLGKIKIT